MRKKIYKWHRALSLIIALPVALWALSGFMHPIMTTIRPVIATQFYAAPVIDTGQVKVSLADALRKNEVDSFSNIHVVQMGGQQFYQVAIDATHMDVRYYSTQTGDLLKNGDELYARFLAKAFLEGPGHKPGDAAPAAYEEPEAASAHDCCIMATVNVMNSKGAPVTAVQRVTSFDGEYKYINRLLPVYKVTFDRADGIRIYVETCPGRFSFAVDNKRAVFDRLFGIFHTWEWMNGLGSTKYFLMVLITLAGLLTTIMGLYIFFTTRSKKSANDLVRARRKHRFTSLIASLFTLLFTFSGGFHALDKILPKDATPSSKLSRFAAGLVNPDFPRMNVAAGNRVIQDISLCSMDGVLYWQLWLAKEKAAGKPVIEGRTDLMKNMQVSQPDVLYVSALDYQQLQDGDRQYANYLADQLRGSSGPAIRSSTPVTRFTDEYGFVNKRLPVWKIAYTTNGNERYYVETLTGLLAARVRDGDLWEEYSFAFFHKHHFMDWAGKSVRDFSTMFWALMQVAMILVGLLLWRKSRRKKTAAGYKR